MKSIIQEYPYCYICGRVNNLEEHHIIFGPNRKLCEEDGLKVYLCPECHRGTCGVHGKEGKELNLKLKRIAQRTWQEYYDRTENDFIKRYGRSYLCD